MILTNTGVLKLMQRIKSFITSQLNTKAASVHTHNASEITDLPDANGYTRSEADGLTSRLNIWGGSNMTSGGRIILYGSDYTTSSEKGRVTLQAFDGSENSLLTLYPSGTFTFNNNGTTKNLAMQEDFIPRSGGNVFSGVNIKRIDNRGYIELYSSSDTSKGGSFGIYSLDDNLFDSLRGAFRLQARDGTNIYSLTGNRDGFLEWNGVEIRADADNKCKLGDGYHRWSTVYSATSAINTSDSRLKNTITDINDKLLDAWETIQPKQYKFNDATETKGEQARFHTGYLAQDIEKACNDNNIDAARYGLFCYDSWEEEPEITEDVEVEKDGIKTTEKRIIQPKREKGDAYSLRYEEALVVECAYLRREISRLKEELKQLKAK